MDYFIKSAHYMKQLIKNNHKKKTEILSSNLHKNL